MHKLSQHFEPGQQIETEFTEFWNENFIILVDSISGFMKFVKTKYKSIAEAIRVLRDWSNIFGAPYRCNAYNGLAYREEFEKDCKKLGIDMIYSSSYNSQSQGWFTLRGCLEGTAKEI